MLSFASLILLAGIGHLLFHHTTTRERSSVSVTVSPVLQKDVVISVHAIGNVLPISTVAVKSRVDGQLLSVGFKEGDFVKAGQIIFEIDSASFEVALEEAKAKLSHDQAALDNYQAIFSRYTPLIKKGYVSKQDYDQARANVRSQKAVVDEDAAEVINAKLNLSFCTIHAPISGRTGSVLINQGNLIKATDPNPLVVINQITPIDISFSLPEQAFSSIQEAIQKQKMEVMVQRKNSTVSLQANLSFLNNAVDTTTGMIQLKALYPNTQEELWPGMYVDVELPLYSIKNALLIPIRAIQEGPEGAFVFVVDKEQKVTKKSIKMGSTTNDMTVVESGLSPGMKVVTTGQLQLVEGSPVTITSNRQSPS